MEEDLPAIRRLLSDAGRWVAERGYDNPWTDPFPPDALVAALGLGALHVIEAADGTLGATVTLLWEDRVFWGEQPPVAGYVHRLAVRRPTPEPGLGGRLVEWAAARTLEHGRRLLRLDCLSSNGPLRAYYERAGFRPRGEVIVAGWACTLFERDLAEFPPRPNRADAGVEHRERVRDAPNGIPPGASGRPRP